MIALARPGAGQNNLWYLTNDSPTVFVFVHGLLSDSSSCWLDTKTNTFWPDLVRNDPRLSQPAIFLGGYYTAPDSGPYEVEHSAQELFSALRLPDALSRQRVLDKPNILFITHSLGGVVTRYLLEAHHNVFTDKTVGLLLIASPSYGSTDADRLGLLAMHANHRLGQQLRWGSWSLRDLDGRFRRLLDERRIGRLCGAEAYENHFIWPTRLWRLLFSRRQLVTAESAGRYFGAPVLLPNTDHFSAAKPDGLDHPSHRFLVDFFTTKFASIASPVSTAPSSRSNPKPEHTDSSPNITTSAAVTTASPATAPDESLLSRYSNIFDVAGFRVPYIVLVGGWDRDINEFRRGDVISSLDPTTEYTLPDEFADNLPKPHYPWKSCRLLSYRIKRRPPPLAGQLTFRFAPVEYGDYLRTGEFLDETIPGSSETFRDRFAPQFEVTSSQLTNITGVGVFVVTREDTIILSKHSANVGVYADAISYTASGTMDWSDTVHPFDEVNRECVEEVAHQLNTDSTLLFGVGVDAKKLFIQFSFVEYSGLSAADIVRHATGARDFHIEMRHLFALPFTAEAIVQLVTENRSTIEPAAAAGLLTLCSKRFGIETLERLIDPLFVRTRRRAEMVAEWARRSTRPGDLPVMSARYPLDITADASRKYVDAVMDFIDSGSTGKAVLEVGCGVGRLTERIAPSAKRMTAIDLSDRMIALNRERLGALARNVTYLHMFAQDYRNDERHDVGVCSLVLIHTVSDTDFENLTRMMAISADVLFIFEHVDVGTQVSAHTHVRPEESITAAFPEFAVTRRARHELLGDDILFLRLERNR